MGLVIILTYNISYRSCRWSYFLRSASLALLFSSVSAVSISLFAPVGPSLLLYNDRPPSSIYFSATILTRRLPSPCIHMLPPTSSRPSFGVGFLDILWLLLSSSFVQTFTYSELVSFLIYSTYLAYKWLELVRIASHVSCRLILIPSLTNTSL